MKKMNVPDRTFTPKNLFDAIGSKWATTAQLTGFFYGVLEK
jgi:hypothetical protein